MAKGYGFMLLTVLFTVYGQLVVKWRVDQTGDLPAGLSEQVQWLGRLVLNPWTISAFALSAVAAVCYFIALTQLEVGRAYLVMSLSFVAVVLLGSPLFGEALDSRKLIGLGLVIVGVLAAVRT